MADFLRQACLSNCASGDQTAPEAFAERLENEILGNAAFYQQIADCSKWAGNLNAVNSFDVARDEIRPVQNQDARYRSVLSESRRHCCFKLHLVPYFKTISIKAIGVKDVAAYIRSREKKGAAANTIYKELAALSAVFTFLVRNEVLVQNPVLAVQEPKLQVIRPNYTPTLEEVNLIFEQLHKWARRFFLALCTTGCRLGEIQKANIGDVSFDRGTLRVIRKGGKPQLIPLNSEALACIEDEVKFRTERLGTEPGADQPLFKNRYGRRYNKIRGSLKAACEKAKVPYITHHYFEAFVRECA